MTAVMMPLRRKLPVSLFFASMAAWLGMPVACSIRPSVNCGSEWVFRLASAQSFPHGESLPFRPARKTCISPAQAEPSVRGMTRHSIGSPPSAGQDAQTTENELGYDWGKNNLSLKGKVNPHSEKNGTLRHSCTRPSAKAHDFLTGFAKKKIMRFP